MTIAVGAGGDAKLLSRIEAFWAAHKETVDSLEKWVAEKHRVGALPECPAFVFPAESRKGYEAYQAFLKDHGVQALCSAFKKANKRQGKTVKAVFDTPARTYQGVLAKLKIVEAALGPGDGRGDENLEVFQDYEAPWLANAIGDFERLVAGGVITANSDAGLLALEAEINAEYATWKAGRVTDDESDEYGERVAAMDGRFAEMPARTLSGVAAKLRHLRYLLVNDGTLRTGDIVLVETSLAAVEQANKAGGNSAARSPTWQ